MFLVCPAIYVLIHTQCDVTVIADERRHSLRYGMKEIVTSVDADLYEVGDYKQPAVDDQRSLLPSEILDQYKSMTREVRKLTTSVVISPMRSSIWGRRITSSFSMWFSIFYLGSAHHVFILHVVQYLLSGVGASRLHSPCGSVSSIWGRRITSSFSMWFSIFYLGSVHHVVFILYVVQYLLSGVGASRLHSPHGSVSSIWGRRIMSSFSTWFSIFYLGSAHHVFKCFFSLYSFLLHVFSYNITPPQFRSSYRSVSTHFHVLITTSSSVFLSTWPNHLSLASLIFSLMFSTPALALIYFATFLIFSILFIPITLNHKRFFKNRTASIENEDAIQIYTAWVCCSHTYSFRI